MGKANNPTGKGGFVKGVSGNAGGKPKAVLEVLAVVKSFEGRVPELLEELCRLALEAANESVRVAAIREALDRIVGKPLQAVALSNAGGPLRVAHGVDLDSLPLETLERIRPAIAAVEEAIAGATAKPG